MAMANHLKSVLANDLPDYPIPSAERLDSHSFFQFHHAWWQNSRFKLTADLEVKGAFIELICASQREAPVGTLPVDDVMLAKLAGVSLEHWLQLVARPVSPLYGWSACLCDNGERKLYHKTVLRVALAASRGKAADAERKASDRERKRLDELPGKIIRAGGTERMSKDMGYVLLLDQFLIDTVPEGKSRTIKVVRDAMERIELSK